MSGIENNNRSIRQRVVLLLRSNSTSLSLWFRKSKIRLSLAGVATLLAVPVAAYAAQSFSAGSDASANLTAQPSDEPALKSEPALLQEVPPVSASSSASSSAGGAQNQAATNTQVTVNGQSIPVPENGSVHRTIDTGNGQVSVNIDNNTTNENNQGNSFTSINSFSSSTSTSVNVNQSTNIGGTQQ